MTQQNVESNHDEHDVGVGENSTKTHEPFEPDHDEPLPFSEVKSTANREPSKANNAPVNKDPSTLRLLAILPKVSPLGGCTSKSSMKAMPKHWRPTAWILVLMELLGTLLTTNMRKKSNRWKLCLRVMPMKQFRSMTKVLSSQQCKHHLKAPTPVIV